MRAWFVGREHRRGCGFLDFALHRRRLHLHRHCFRVTGTVGRIESYTNSEGNNRYVTGNWHDGFYHRFGVGF